MSSTNFPLRLTVNTLVLLLLLKFYFFVAIQNKLSYLYLLSYIQDAFLFMVNYCLFVYCFSPVKMLRPVGFLFFVLFFIPISALTFTYTFFLLDLYHFPMNIFSISADSFLFFLTYFASPVSIAAFFAIYAVLFSFSYYIPKHLAYSNLIKPACLLLTFLFLPTSVRPALTPSFTRCKNRYTPIYMPIPIFFRWLNPMMQSSNHRILAFQTKPLILFLWST